MKEKFSKVLLAFAAFATVFTVFSGSAKASGTTITQASQTQTTIDITWTTPTGSYNSTVQNVYLAYDTDYTAARTAAETAGIDVTGKTSYTLTGLKPGMQYRVYIYYTETRYGATRQYGGSLNAKTLPGPLANLNQDRWYRWIHDVNIKWDEQTAAEGYEYKFMTYNGKNVESGTRVSASYSHKIKNNMIYKFRARSYATVAGTKVYGDWTECYCMIQPSKGDAYADVNAKISGGKLKVSWQKLNGADGYNVYVSTKKDSGYKKVKSVNKKTSSVTISKLNSKKFKSSKTYYIYVQAYKKVGKNKVTTGANYITTLKNNKTGYIYR